MQPTKLVDIPDGIPNTTTQLDLKQNNIVTIAADAFINLTSLELLNLGFNQISSLTANVFNGLVSMKTMILSNNQISIIAADTFKCVLLKTLLLDRNKISTIASDTFKDLVSLDYIYLDNNKISTIATDTFKDLVSLTYITLNDNAFTAISANIFRKLTNITTLYLSFNLICCNMTDFFKWKASQTELNDLVGKCIDFDSVTDITEFDISNCTIPVDGHWGSWSTTSCSVTCGSGTKYRNRICNNPSPSDGGKHCVGEDTELSQCRLRHCPASCKHSKAQTRNQIKG
ncbi:unnamed protein product [Mytilus edulis]|uniref:Uncharacterized protein n=1 Tax=Mytilus edulis TaxID=6550 RepID=A0A8S3U1L6_MYTED|nr:unnamed protein product [Mytilus edulis]